MVDGPLLHRLGWQTAGRLRGQRSGVRIIFSCVPQTGHIMPLLPLAQAFAARGDDVTVASGPDAEAIVTSRGLAFRRR